MAALKPWSPGRQSTIPPETPPRVLYQYEPLPTAKPSFRLLRISPELEDGMIRCDLVVKEFPVDTPMGRQRGDSSIDSSDTCYNALSYEWARVPVYGWIVLNDGCINVGENLFNFLHTARAHITRGSEPNLGKYLWIDALCINQKDVQEKQHQIKQMGALYQGAQNVFVWLGSYVTEAVHAGATELRAMGDQADEHDMLIKGKGGRIRYPKIGNTAEEMLNSNGKALPAFIEITHNTYWDRMWILQEILLAKDARVMMENYIFSWTLIKRTLLSYEGFHHKDFVNAPTKRIVQAFRHYEYATIINPSVCDTVARLGQGECKEVHDKVYATLGLNGPAGIPVDYSVTLPELFYTVLLASFHSSHDSAHLRQDFTMSALSAANTFREVLQVPFSALEDHLLNGNDDALRRIYFYFPGRPTSQNNTQERAMQHKRHPTKFISRLHDIKDFDHPFEEILITIAQGGNPDEQSICKVKCKLSSITTAFTDEAFVPQPLSSFLAVKGHFEEDHLSFSIQTFLFVLKVMHNTLLFTRLAVNVHEGKGMSFGEEQEVGSEAYTAEETEQFTPFKDKQIQRMLEDSY
ncbi:uncharacterized protein N0V89_000053 [Didymosphaeria variabile]|uniref:Heterokaryon incompatibility domain-containing protein n=1 Tax=Didymosphaeria variabile TaxID=1932322 RepID=A0A9W8XUE4_9PLEO|nr:uncharacterized protein N0V89_000053 [Didymosphaeria variabile]KAJ4359498.1 hypothetical protein N0V89_000053 [Didymosphaeria variabile]